MTIWRALVLGALGMVGMGVAMKTALAQERIARHLPPPPVIPCSVSVEDAGGRSLATYHAGGKTFVLGERGERYSIRVRNNSDERIEAVVTVDGRDVISGQAGNYVTNRGYVIHGYDSVDIRGFRQNLDSVATFRFSSPHESYSSRMGTPENVGVIGVACFRERPAPVVIRPPIAYRYRDRHQPRPAPEPAPEESERSSKPRASGAAPDRGYAPTPQRTYNLGTEYGESRFAPVSTTSFVREHASRPRQIVTLHYDDAEGLAARGIRVYWFPTPRPRYAPPAPDPFPESRFAPPPPR